MLRTWRCLTLVLAALSLTMESAHVLEMPQKLRYDPALDATVNGSLYRWFAITVVAPVNAAIADALRAAPDSVPGL